MPARDSRPQHRLLAILAADGVGYSRLMSQDDRGTVTALDAARDVFRAEVTASGGHIVDTAGDSVLASFGTARGAVEAAIAIQALLEPEGDPAPALRFRIGVHIGDVIEKTDGSVYGDGVNIAARLQALADPGGINVSHTVQGLVTGHVEAGFRDLGDHRVKNIAQPVRVFRIGPPGTSSPEAPARDQPVRDVREQTLAGRAELTAEITDALAGDDVRLVTLTGPGGTGKTRMALHIAQTVTFEDGVQVALLAPVRETEHVVAALAAAVGIQESGATPVADLLRSYLQPRSMLLVIDNLEHLPQANAIIAGLLDDCPQLKVLTTSRGLLHLRGEHQIAVPPLSLPLGDEPEQLRASGAVTLFAQRAASHGRDLMADPDDLRCAAEICRRLDGLPLALELAAARLRVLTPSVLLARLDHRLQLLKGGDADAPARQQTLRNAIAWSDDLLDPESRLLMRRVSVFTGGFTLEGAESVDDDPVDTVDRLEHLLDQSLILRTEDVAGQPRYMMLETIREYALEQLAGADEEAAARDRHAAYVIELVTALEPALTSTQRPSALAGLRGETNNIRAALAWLTRTRRDTERARRLAAGLPWLWYFDGLYQEGLAWIREVLEPPDPDGPLTSRAALLSGRARLAAYSGDPAGALAAATESVELWEALDDVRGTAFALFHRGLAQILLHEGEGAGRDYTASLECFRRLDDSWGVALASSYLGISYVIRPGCEEQARELLMEGRTRFQGLGDDWGLTVTSHYLGSIALRTGDHGLARELNEEALANARELDDRYRIARNLHQLAQIALAEGDATAAIPLLRESIMINDEQRRYADACVQLHTLAQVASEQDQLDDAVHFSALADRFSDAGPSILAEGSPSEDRHALEDALGPARYKTQWELGRAMSIADVAARLDDWVDAAARAAGAGIDGPR